MTPNPNLPAVVTQDVHRTVLVNPTRGTGLTIATAAETVEVDPVTGSRIFNATTSLIVTVDGPIVTDPSTLCACEVCGRAPFTSEAVMRCNCGRVACKLNCLVNDEAGPLCRVCAATPWWRRLWLWLTRLP